MLTGRAVQAGAPVHVAYQVILKEPEVGLKFTEVAEGPEGFRISAWAYS